MLIDMVNLRLSAQRALLWNVFPKLRAVCVDSKENRIYVCFYCDGEISEEDKELCESVLDDIIADFFITKEEDRIEFETPIIRMDYPKKMLLNGIWVFYRNEDTSRYID